MLDVGEHQFSIGPNSEAIDAGDPNFLLTFPNDILGIVRDTNPDMGAFEFAPGN